MFPEQSAVLWTQIAPTAGVGYETCVEAINLGLAHEFAVAAAKKWANKRGDMGQFQHLQIVDDDGPAQSAEGGQR